MTCAHNSNVFAMFIVFGHASHIFFCHVSHNYMLSALSGWSNMIFLKCYGIMPIYIPTMLDVCTTVIDHQEICQ